MRKILFLLIISGIFCSADMFAKDKTKKYKNGDVYVGEIVKGMPEGKGTMTYANGDVYTGNWHKGDPDGQGTMTYADNSKFVGEWNYGEKYDGSYTYPNGDTFVGKWSSGKIKEGVLTISKDNCVYMGRFHPYTGKLEKGTITKDGDVLQIGVWSSGRTDNVLTMKNGTSMKGSIDFDGSSFVIGYAEGTYVISPDSIFEGYIYKDEFSSGTLTVTPTKGDKKLVYKESYSSEGVSCKTWIVPNELNPAAYSKIVCRKKDDSNFLTGQEIFLTEKDIDTEDRYTGTFIRSGETMLKHGHGKFLLKYVLEIEGEWNNNVLVSGTGRCAREDEKLTIVTSNGVTKFTVKTRYATYNKTVSPDTCSVLNEAIQFFHDKMRAEYDAHHEAEDKARMKQQEKERQAQRAKNMREGRKVFHKCTSCKGEGTVLYMDGTGRRVTCTTCGGTRGYWDY